MVLREKRKNEKGKKITRKTTKIKEYKEQNRQSWCAPAPPINGAAHVLWHAHRHGRTPAQRPLYISKDALHVGCLDNASLRTQAAVLLLQQLRKQLELRQIPAKRYRDVRTHGLSGAGHGVGLGALDCKITAVEGEEGVEAGSLAREVGVYGSAMLGREDEEEEAS
jgi:hypothetical protein